MRKERSDDAFISFRLPQIFTTSGEPEYSIKGFRPDSELYRKCQERTGASHEGGILRNG